MKKLFFITIFLLFFCNTVFADHKSGSIDKHTKKLENFLINNNWFQHGVWIEVKNSSGWEKTTLIFAYGEWGNMDHCLSILKKTEPQLLKSGNIRCRNVES